jgi:hypothetical protein
MPASAHWDGMNWKRIVLVVFGVVLVLLGGLWFLQGAGIVHLEPVACVGACEPLTRPSLQWVAIGGVVLLAGIVLAGAGLRRPRKN